MNSRQLGIRVLTSLTCLLAFKVASAYPVGEALTIEKLVEKADFVCKAVVVSSKPLNDPWFDALSGFEAQQSELKIIEVFKGANLTKASFQHYASDPKSGSRHSPQHYDFIAGRTYLIFASKTDHESVFRQITKHHTSQEDQGGLLAADDSLHPGKAIKSVIWLELTGLLKSDKPEDIKYAIQHLNRMSDGLHWGEPVEFPRDDVLKLVFPLLASKEASVADEAISALGTNNPMMLQDFAPGWLATIGKGHIPGFGAWDTAQANVGGHRYWKELAAIVDSDASSQARSRAVRALGRAQQPEIRPLVMRWIQDKDPQVVRSAVLLLSDYLQHADNQRLEELGTDPREQVRIGVATAIGYGQIKTLIPVLSNLVNDQQAAVSAAAALSLLSFSLDDSEATLKANLTHANFGPLFVNALAQRYGLAYTDELCKIIHDNPQPENWWGGFVVWGDSWNILFKAAQSATQAELKSKKFAKILTALEAPASGDPKAATYYSSSEPRDLYALYLQKGMADHAKEFRSKAQKAIRYDIDYYFKQVDENPGLYIRGQ